jgi:hypothetical protein
LRCETVAQSPRPQARNSRIIIYDHRRLSDTHMSSSPALSINGRLASMAVRTMEIHALFL